MSDVAAPPAVMRRVLTLYAVLIPANIAAWVWAFVLLHDRPVLLGTAALAYGFGLRHAIDADHIAAIDNVTRKLMQEGQRPVAVGLFFAIGHSSIVFVASLLVGITAGALQQVEGLKSIGGVISTLISSGFLFAIGLINLSILRDLIRTLRGLRSGEVDLSTETFPIASGLLARVLKPLFGLIRRSWHMAPLGLLFGLGFETATEVGVMGLSASQASSGAPVAVALVFPTLFAAGMTLVDATDGILMMRVYQWAFVDPRRKLYYNCIITLVSALIAILISGIEVAGLIVDNFGFSGALSLVADLSGHFNLLGAVIVVVFIGGWLASMGFSRARRTTESVLTTES
jgi:nickel/cobalt transporter (NiCoT) family protein